MAAEKARLEHPEPARAGMFGFVAGPWLKAQLWAAGLLALVAGLWGFSASLSSVYGSMAAFLPAVFFAAYAGRKFGASSAAFLQAAVFGEALKLALTAVICMAVFRWAKDLAPGWFFAGMITVIMAGWAGLARGLNSDR